MTLKDWRKNYKNIGIILIVFVVFFIYFIVYNIFWNNKKQEITEEWINISQFPTTLEIDKEWNLSSYPEVTVLAESDWQVMNLNVSEWDIVEEWDILMQIWEENWVDENTDIDTRISRKFAEYYQKKDEYNQFESEFWEEISILEKNLAENSAAFSIAVDINDEETIENMQEKIQDTNERLNLLKRQRENLKSSILRLESEILLENQENIEYYYELDKKIPRAPIQWIVSEIYVNEWDEVKNWDKLFKIIDNMYSPEIAVWLNFNEYLLTQDLTWVQIITENENRWDSYYEWEIYTRSPILNEEWEYTITVRIIEEVSDLILNDKNTKITVIFTRDFPTIWIPYNCFSEVWKNSWKLTLRDGEVITSKEIWIKNKWNNWINIDNLTPYSLENEEKKDEINLCIESWNNDSDFYGDESILERRNQFETVEDFCAEFVKVDSISSSDQENISVVKDPWLKENTEILCRVDSEI